MTAKEYLKQAFNLDKLINSNIEELAGLRELASSIPSQDLSKDRVQGGGTSDRIGSLVSNIVDLETKINCEIDCYVNLKTEIRERIMKLPNDNLRLILQKRYLNFDKWEKIAVDMDKDMRWIFRLHKKGLKVFAKIYYIDH